MGQQSSLPVSSSFGTQLSVIIPTLNEEGNIESAVRSVLAGTCARCQPEVILVDGGSKDNTVERARACARSIKVLTSAPGRGKQQNLGWQASSRPWCLFLHGDSQLPPNYLAALQQGLQSAQPHVIQTSAAGGSTGPSGSGARTQGSSDVLDSSSDLTHAIRPGSRRVGRLRAGAQRPYTAKCAADCACGNTEQHSATTPGVCSCSSPVAVTDTRHDDGTWMTQLSNRVQQLSNRHHTPLLWGCFETIQTSLPGWRDHLLSHSVRLRTRWCGLPYGDQALFVNRGALEQVGGVPELPLMEDCELVRRLKRACGPPAILPLAIHTSGRRWERHGYWKTCLMNQAILLAWMLGVPPERLAQWYYQRKATD